MQGPHPETEVSADPMTAPFEDNVPEGWTVALQRRKKEDQVMKRPLVAYSAGRRLADADGDLQQLKTRLEEEQFVGQWQTTGFKASIAIAVCKLTFLSLAMDRTVGGAGNRCWWAKGSRSRRLVNIGDVVLCLAHMRGCLHIVEAGIGHDDAVHVAVEEHPKSYKNLYPGS